MLSIWCKKYFGRMLLWLYNYCAIVSHLSIYASWVSDLVKSDMVQIQLRNNAQNYWPGENSKTLFDLVKFDKNFLTQWGFLTLAKCVFDMTRWNFLPKSYDPVNFSFEIFNPVRFSKHMFDSVIIRVATGSLTQGVFIWCVTVCMW